MQTHRDNWPNCPINFSQCSHRARIIIYSGTGWSRQSPPHPCRSMRRQAGRTNFPGDNFSIRNIEQEIAMQRGSTITLGLLFAGLSVLPLSSQAAEQAGGMVTLTDGKNLSNFDK